MSPASQAQALLDAVRYHARPRTNAGSFGNWNVCARCGHARIEHVDGKWHDEIHGECQAFTEGSLR